MSKNEENFGGLDDFLEDIDKKVSDDRFFDSPSNKEGSLSESIAEDDFDESTYYGGGKGLLRRSGSEVSQGEPDFTLSDFYDEENPEETRLLDNESQSMIQEINKINTESELPQENDDDFIKQSLINRHNLQAFMPSDTSLLDVFSEKNNREKKDYSAGDAKTVHGATVFLISCVFLCVASIVFGAWITSASKPDPIDPLAAQKNGPVAMGSGNPIDSSNNDSASAPTTGASPGGQNESHSEGVRIPEGGVKVEYKITATGDVKGSSATYLEGDGTQEKALNIKLPWTKSVGMEGDVFPQIAVSSTGSGVTLTCSIFEEGEEIAKEISSGDNPTVECVG